MFRARVRLTAGPARRADQRSEDRERLDTGIRVAENGPTEGRQIADRQGRPRRDAGEQRCPGSAPQEDDPGDRCEADWFSQP
jgi:hypothetical protein